jgi:hypothetical protein
VKPSVVGSVRILPHKGILDRLVAVENLPMHFALVGMTVSPRTPTAGGRKAPRQEIAGWERRWCCNYGDFAAGAGVDVAERGGKVRNFATRHGRELGCERVTDRAI